MGKSKKGFVPGLLGSKGELTKFMILAEVFRSQPHVKQRDVGETLGITVQAVSKYFKKLIREGLLESYAGRAQYRLTPKAHEKLEEYISELESYVMRLRRELKFERVCPAIASFKVRAGEKVNVEMRDGVLYAVPFKEGARTASGVAILDAEPGEDVGLTDVKGMVRMETGKVLIVKLPCIKEGGSRAVDMEKVKALYEEVKPHRIGVMGTVGRAVLNKLGLKAHIEFGISTASALAA
ncbi:MAG: winged helix-turn-helix transcriptional regulator, partial [Candidatus Bathyarchaeia archaeon]